MVATGDLRRPSGAPAYCAAEAVTAVWKASSRGLRSYLTEFLERINDLGERVSEDFSSAFGSPLINWDAYDLLRSDAIECRSRLPG